MQKFSTFLAALSIVAIANAAGTEKEEQSFRSFADLIPSDAVSNVQVFEANGFRIESAQNKELGAELNPSGNRFESLIVTGDDIFKVAVEKGRPMSTGGGLAIFHRTAGTPMLSAGDQNGDGIIDILSYSVVGEDGKAIREVVDYDADGQANLRIHFDEGYAELWHLDRWNRVEERDGQRGIVIDGNFTKVENIDNHLFVQ